MFPLRIKSVFLFLFFILCSYACFSQQEGLQAFNQQRIENSNHAMYVLGGWAISNIAISGIQRSRHLGEKRYFHEMNVFWNLVNLGIAGAALYGNAKADPSSLGLFESIQEQQRLEKILWFNVALNGSYMLGGFWMREKAKNSLKNPQRLTGYGNSLILQGSFLLVYDLVHVLIQQSHSLDSLEQLLTFVQVSSEGFAFRFIF